MTDIQKQSTAKEFTQNWTDKGREKGDSQAFWLAFIRDLFGINKPEKFIEFDKEVFINNWGSKMDGYLPDTKVIIEHKGLGLDLTKKSRQSDGEMLTPYEQALRYNFNLPQNQKANWIVVCNFQEFHIHDMNKQTHIDRAKPEIILLADLAKEYYRFDFLLDPRALNIQKETEISLQAGEIVGKLHKEILAQYKDANDPQTLRSLNIL
jgi:hypothetical protein